MRRAARQSPVTGSSGHGMGECVRFLSLPSTFQVTRRNAPPQGSAEQERTPADGGLQAKGQACGGPGPGHHDGASELKIITTYCCFQRFPDVFQVKGKVKSWGLELTDALTEGAAKAATTPRDTYVAAEPGPS